MKSSLRIKSVCAVMLLAAVSVAQETPTTAPSMINVTDKAALEAVKGTTVTVEGKIALAEWSKSGKVMNIEFADAPHFMGAVFEKSRSKLDEAFGGDLAKSITGATVRITGKVADYGGKAEKYVGTMQIILSGGNQLTVLAPATQPTP